MTGEVQNASPEKSVIFTEKLSHDSLIKKYTVKTNRNETQYANKTQTETFYRKNNKRKMLELLQMLETRDTKQRLNKILS